MMPRLEAEETMETANAMALGAGSMSQRDAQRYTATLIRKASGAKPEKRRQPPSPAALAVMGIRVVEVPLKVSRNGVEADG